MNAPHSTGLDLDPDCTFGDLISMTWRAVPRAPGPQQAANDEAPPNGPPQDSSSIEARWGQRCAARNRPAYDELNDAFLCFTNRTPGLNPRG